MIGGTVLRLSMQPFTPLSVIAHDRNSTAYDEFARKWNRPIHEWYVAALVPTFEILVGLLPPSRLLVHVYNRRIKNNHSKSSALWITFFFSHFIYEVTPLFLLITQA